jgi:hypothetical protein
MVLSLDRPVEADESTPVEPPADRARPRVWRHWPSALIALAYLGAAVAIMGTLWADPSGRTFAANPSDQTWFEWMLVHGVRVFTHGENPLHTAQLNAPAGVNLMANTNVLTLSLLMAPLTALLGPSIVYALLLTLGLAGTAYAWYHVIYRHLLHDRIAAIVGGAICGFGPGIIAHTNGHPNLTAQFLVPLILWRVLALRTSRHLWRDGAIVTALVIGQLFINEEVLLNTALAGTLFVIAYALMHPSALHDAPRLLAGVGIAALFGVVLAAYPIWYQFTANGHVDGLPAYQHDFPYRLPLVSFVTLPSQSLFGSPNPTLSHPAEENSFLGWAMVAVVAAIVILLWRRQPAVRALAVVGVVFAYASLGDRISVSNPELSYPYSLWSHLQSLPVFNSILPTRLALVVLPVVGLLFAYGIASARAALRSRPRPERPEPPDRIAGRRRSSVRVLDRAASVKRPLAVRATAVLGLLAMAGALVTIVPTQPPTTAREPVPAFFTDGTWREYVPAGYTVLTADPVDRVANMRWSIVNGLAFGIPGGYFIGPDDAGVGRFGPVPRPTLSLLITAERGHSVSPTRARIKQAVADIRYWHTAIIVLTDGHPGESQTFKLLDGLFGPAQNVDGVWIWDVRALTDGPEETYAGVGGGAVAPLPLSVR